MRAAIIIFTLIAGLGLLCTLYPGKSTTVKLITGTVTSVYEQGSTEAICKISGTKWGFSLKKDFLKNFNLKDLKQHLVGQQVTIHYIDKWKPFDPASNKQVASIAVGKELMYSEQEQK